MVRDENRLNYINSYRIWYVPLHGVCIWCLTKSRGISRQDKETKFGFYLLFPEPTRLFSNPTAASPPTLQPRPHLLDQRHLLEASVSCHHTNALNRHYQDQTKCLGGYLPQRINICLIFLCYYVVCMLLCIFLESILSPASNTKTNHEFNADVSQSNHCKGTERTPVSFHR